MLDENCENHSMRASMHFLWESSLTRIRRAKRRSNRTWRSEWTSEKLHISFMQTKAVLLRSEKTASIEQPKLHNSDLAECALTQNGKKPAASDKNKIVQLNVKFCGNFIHNFASATSIWKISTEVRIREEKMWKYVASCVFKKGRLSRHLKSHATRRREQNYSYGEHFHKYMWMQLDFLDLRAPFMFTRTSFFEQENLGSRKIRFTFSGSVDWM